MLSAGTNVEWLRDDLGIIGTAAESHDVASRCETRDGVVYVPALLGLRHPPTGTTAPAARCSGSPAAASGPRSCGPCSRAWPSAAPTSSTPAEADTGLTIPSLRVDGGMTDNPTFVQALADASQRPVEVSPVKEATTLGAAFLAGLAVGTWGSWDDIAATWRPRAVVEPNGTLDREQWAKRLRPGGGLDPGALVADLLIGARRSLLRSGPWGRDTGGRR